MARVEPAGPCACVMYHGRMTVGRFTARAGLCPTDTRADREARAPGSMARAAFAMVVLSIAAGVALMTIGALLTVF